MVVNYRCLSFVLSNNLMNGYFYNINDLIIVWGYLNPPNYSLHPITQETYSINLKIKIWLCTPHNTKNNPNLIYFWIIKLFSSAFLSKLIFYGLDNLTKCGQ